MYIYVNVIIFRFKYTITLNNIKRPTYFFFYESSMANPGGWVDFHGNLPTVVVDAVRDTLTTQENLEVEHMNFTNIQSQVHFLWDA